MKHFLKRISIYLMPVLISLLTIEYLVRQIPNNYSYKQKLINSKDFKGIILGNSHAYRGIVAHKLKPKTINLANVSQSVDIDHAYFNSLNKNKPSFMILNLSFPSFYGRLSAGQEKWRIKNYNIYTKLQLDHTLKNNFEILNGQFKTDIVENYKYYYHNKDNKTCLQNGSEPSNNIKDLAKSSRVAAKRHTANGNEFFNANTLTIEKMIDKAEKKNIKVILVTLPAYKAYRNNLDEEMLAKMFTFMKQLKTEYSQLEHLNYFNSSRFDKTMFKDGDHLNKKGAYLFTELLNEQLDKISF